MAARALMVLGTASHVGKSLVTAALGRILSDRGFRVAPFKAQNMSLNSAVTADGAEIGRAQAMQAAAACIEPEAAMNPVLLKPGSDRTSQVVVLGKPWADVSALSYQGRVEDRPLLGNGPAPSVDDIGRAARLSTAVALTAGGLAVAAAAVRGRS